MESRDKKGFLYVIETKCGGFLFENQGDFYKLHVSHIWRRGDEKQNNRLMSVVDVIFKLSIDISAYTYILELCPR